MSAVPVPRIKADDEDQFVLTVKQLHEALRLVCHTAGVEIQLSQNDVASLVYVEEEGLLMGGRLKATLYGGSTVSIHCDLENAQGWSTLLLPEERDHEFMLHAKDGQCRNAWGDQF